MKPEEGALIDAFEESFQAIDLLCDHHLIQSALVLLYATIDAAAWLDVKGEDDVTRSDFVSWVERYFLPDSGLRCNALDLYGARCGVLHSLTAFSKLSREGKVRTVTYARGTAKVDRLDEMAVLLRRTDLVGVHVDDLRSALRKGMQAFLDDAALTPERWENLRKRSKSLFSHLPVLRLDNAIDTIKSQNA